MSTQKHILIVEDVPFIYHEVTSVVESAGFSVDAYTPSVNDAIARIQKRRPDLVLLDIKLKGKEDGTHLGNLLKTEYHIPFIYVTDFDDDFTFNKSSQTSPEVFMSKKTLQLSEDDVVIKTKPEFDEKHLIQQIILVHNATTKNQHHQLKMALWRL